MSDPSHARPLGIVRGSEKTIRLMVAFVGATLAVLAGLLALFRLGGSIVPLSYDIPFLVHRAGSADELRIVYLDELDGEFLNRERQPELLDRLREAGARAVVYDIIFDRRSEDPAIDQAFAAAMRRFRGLDASDRPLPGEPRGLVMLACGRGVFRQTGAIVEHLVAPNDELIAAADDFGLVAFVHDDSFTVRELNTGSADEASLAWKSAVALGALLDDRNRLHPRWINYLGPPPRPDDQATLTAVPSCLARNVLDGVDPAFFRDKIVLVGGKPGIVGAAAGVDLFSTPFHRFDRRGELPLISGVEIQANALSNLLLGNWLSRSSHRFDWWMIVVAGLLAGAGLTQLPPGRMLVAVLAGALILVAAGILVMHYARIWFPWTVVALVQLPVALVWAVGSRFYVERFFRLRLGAEQRALREAFAKYLSPQMLDRLTAEGFQTKIGGDKVQAAMMFTDIESFTEMCQRVRDPENIVITLNDYFERTTGHIFDHDGVVIKFIGDAIFAAWGAPLADPEAARKAVRAAWKVFISARLVVGGVELRTRIGLHYGEVVAGNMGSSRHVDYTLIGDDVNLASRLESLNKLLDTNILLSDSIHEHLGREFHTRRVGRFRVKGRKDVTVVHELLGPSSDGQPPPWVADYDQALIAFQHGDHSCASALFSSVMDSRGPPGDGPSRFFLQLIKNGPPPPEGIVELKEK